MESITILGSGKIGTSLAEAIQHSHRQDLAGIIPARSREFEIDSEIVIIATRDDMVVETSRKVIENASERLELIVQTAGSIAPRALAMRQGVSALTLHPMQTVSEPNPEAFRGIYWMACSEDPQALEWASNFTAELGGIGLLVLEEQMLPLYHAMTVFSSNFITLLFAGVEQMAESLELDPQGVKQALSILSKTALDNAIAKPANSVLTGPFARKDMLTIRRHQLALAALDPKLKNVYDAFLNYVMKKTKR